MRHLTLAALLALAAACSGTTTDEPTDAGSTTPDAGTTTPDAGTTTPDAGTTTAVPLEGFGTISGDCGVLDTELTSSSNHAFRNRIDFGTNPYDEADKPELTEGGVHVLETPNAGGSSIYSEVFAFELLARCELATLVHTETEITYSTTSTKITDMEVEIDGEKIGVSVTRAVTFPHTAEYTLTAASALLKKKLEGINISSQNVSAGDKWRKQILAVIALSDAHANVFQQAWDEADEALKADTILVLTVSDGDDEFIYSNG